MSAAGVSEERITIAVADLRIDEGGWDGPLGGAQGVMRILSIVRGVEEERRRSVMVAEVIVEGREERRRVGLGTGFTSSSRPQIVVSQLHSNPESSTIDAPESSPPLRSENLPLPTAGLSNAASSFGRLFSLPPPPPNTPATSSSSRSNALSKFRFLMGGCSCGGPPIPPRLVKCLLPGPLSGAAAPPLNPPPPNPPLVPLLFPYRNELEPSFGSSSNDATKSL